MTVVSRTYQIKYGSLTMDTAASGFALEGPIEKQFSYRETTFSFSVVVYGSSVADFESKCATLILGIRTPRQDLIVKLGSRTLSYKLSDNTGFFQDGTIEPEAGSIFNTHLTREFSISIRVKTPQNLAGDAGLEDYTYIHSIGPDGIRRFSVSGIITTNGTTNLAEAQYEATIAAIITTIKAEIDAAVNWTEILEQRGIELYDFSMTFTRSYVERIFKDSMSADDVAAIKQPQITITPSLIFDASAAPDIPRPIEITATYSAFIDKRESVDLNAVWLEHVIPILQNTSVEYATQLYGNDLLSIQELTPTFSPTGNTISGFCRFVVFGEQRVLSAQIEESYNATSGVIKVGLYGSSPYQRIRLPGLATAKAVLLATVIVQGSTAEALSAARGFANTPNLPGPPGNPLKFPAYRLLKRSDASKLGGNGGGWSLENEDIRFIGPVYSGDPPLPISTCILTRVFDYDEEAPRFLPKSSGASARSDM